MKKISILFLTSIMMLALSACINDEPTKPSAGALSQLIEADPNLLVAGQWVEFEVEELTAPTPGYTTSYAIWTVNGNQLLADNCKKEGNEYKAEVLLDKTVTEVNVKLEISYYYASERVSVVAEQIFSVSKPDVHQFVWGNEKDVIEENINAQYIDNEDVLFYPQVYSEYWTLNSELLSQDYVMAKYTFDLNERLNKLTEAYIEKLADETDKSYTRVIYRYEIAYKRLSDAFGMNPIIADWQSQPTEEQVAALEQVLTNYSTASKEAKAMVGKAIVENQLRLGAESNESSNTHVKFVTSAGETASVDFMMTFTPKNK